MTDKPAAPAALPLHPYISTACLHGKHELCRRTCKFCEAPCQCRDCVHATFSGSYYLKDGYVYCSGCHRAPEYCGCAPSPLPSAPATPTMRNTAERANRAAERIWREFVDDSKRDINKIRDIICIYLVAERDQARESAVPAPPSPAPIDRASWQAGVSAAIQKVANMVFDVHQSYLSDSIVRELQSLEPPFPAPVSSARSSEVSALRDPTAEELANPRFNAVWNAIKHWDIKRPTDSGYHGATGTDVCTILDALGGQRDDAVSSEVPSAYMHEDELPENMPITDYEEWYRRSWIPHGAGYRVGPIYPFKPALPDPPESEPK